MFHLNLFSPLKASYSLQAKKVIKKPNIWMNWEHQQEYISDYEDATRLISELVSEIICPWNVGVVFAPFRSWMISLKYLLRISWCYMRDLYLEKMYSGPLTKWPWTVVSAVYSAAQLRLLSLYIAFTTCRVQ